MPRIVASLLFCLLSLIQLTTNAAEGDFPAWYETTTSLNVRETGSKYGRKVTTLPPHTEIQVNAITSSGWAEVEYGYSGKGYVSSKYIRYLRDMETAPVEAAAQAPAKKSGKGLWGWIGTLIGIVIVFIIVRKIGIYALGLASVLMYKAYWIVCIPSYISNWLQRYLAKPWRFWHKGNTRSDRENARLRDTYEWIKVPLYILLTPLRFFNAFYFNMIVHCTFEMYNYLIEIFVPSNDDEGGRDMVRLVVLAPWRILKYVIWHGGLTVIESGVWTIVDTFVPALTLYHGTNESAATTITHAGRDGYKSRYTGIWNVGGGNYAGNGIYFAPARSTALHYARGSLIVCRVTLGKVLDLGLAPGHIYRQCGHPNATGATKWGLDNGYVTGEWWRKDEGWWEYCMYDWQNRYNYSWRIRPLFVLNLDEKYMQRIPGGMVHWLFRSLVIKDIKTYFNEQLA